MQGKRTLFPLGYHCTGLPIKASADKLVKEVEMFGRDFERYKAEDEEEVIAAPVAKGPKDDLSKFNAKKGKAAAKTVKAKYQFQILHSVGIPLEEIHLFADPQYWSVPLAHISSHGQDFDTASGCSSSPLSARRT
jgi:leucyl-tRNA synthetase